MAGLTEFMMQADADVTERLEASRAELDEMRSQIQAFYAAVVRQCQGADTSLEATPWGPDVPAVGVLQGGSAEARGGVPPGSFTSA